MDRGRILVNDAKITLKPNAIKAVVRKEARVRDIFCFSISKFVKGSKIEIKEVKAAINKSEKKQNPKNFPPQMLLKT